MKEFRKINSDVNIDDNRKISGYAIVFDSISEDLGFREIIHKNSIDQKSIDGSDIFCYFNHDSSKVLARSKFGSGSLKLTVDERGLKYEFDAPKSQIGDELIEYLKRGDLSGSSFAFKIDIDDKTACRWTRTDDNILKRDVYKIAQIYEVSPVFSPAYTQTECKIADEMRSMCNKIDEEQNKYKEEIKKLIAEIRAINSDDKISDDIEHKVQNIEQILNDANENLRFLSTDDKKTISEYLDEISIFKSNLTDSTDKIESREDISKIENDKNLNINIINNMKFSLIKAINDVVNNRALDEVTSAVCKRGIEEMRNSGASYSGQIQLPMGELRSALTVSAEGEDVVATDIFDIEAPLRAQNVFVKAGARYLSGLVGDVQIPLMTGNNVYWERETVKTAKDTEVTFTSVKFSPRRLTAYCDISKTLLTQTSDSVEQLIREDLVNAINAKIEETILSNLPQNSTGVASPGGIFPIGGVEDEVNDFASICEIESTVEGANIYGDCKYIMMPKTKAYFRSTTKGSNSGFICENNMIDGTEVLTTSNFYAITHNITDDKYRYGVYGDFSKLVICNWGSVDILVDPYSLATNNQVRIVLNCLYDFKFLYDDAYVPFAIEKFA